MNTDVSEQLAASVFKNIALTMEAAGFKCRCGSTRLDGFVLNVDVGQPG